MIMSRYRYHFSVSVTDRCRFRANVTKRDINVTDRYQILPLHALQALPILIKGFLNRYLKFYKKINVTLVTQVTVRFGNGQ